MSQTLSLCCVCTYIPPSNNAIRDNIFEIIGDQSMIASHRQWRFMAIADWNAIHPDTQRLPIRENRRNTPNDTALYATIQAHNLWTPTLRQHHPSPVQEPYEYPITWKTIRGSAQLGSCLDFHICSQDATSTLFPPICQVLYKDYNSDHFPVQVTIPRSIHPPAPITCTRPLLRIRFCADKVKDAVKLFMFHYYIVEIQLQQLLHNDDPRVALCDAYIFMQSIIYIVRLRSKMFTIHAVTTACCPSTCPTWWSPKQWTGMPLHTPPNLVRTSQNQTTTFPQCTAILNIATIRQLSEEYGTPL